MRVLVTDGHTRAALALTRGLGREHEVAVSAPGKRSLAGSSRHCAVEHPQAGTAEGPAALRDGLVRLVRETRPDVVIGVTDPTLTVLHEAAAELAPSILAPPAREPYLAASDKVRLFALAHELGIAAPDGVAARGGEVPHASELAALGRPLVVRPAYSWREDGARWIQGPVSYEQDRAALAARVARDPALALPYLVQRRVEGEGCGLFVLAANGVLVSAFGHRRLREKPPEGGVSTFCEAVAPDEALLAAARKLVAALGFSGLAMLEFKRGLDGLARLLEVNARPWGSLALATAAGLSFPADLVALALARHPAVVTHFRPGVRLRWWWGEVDHFYLTEKAKGRRGARAMLRSMVRAAAAGPWPDAWDTARLDDPIPFAVETVAWLRA